MSNQKDQDDFWKMVVEESEKRTNREERYMNGDPSDFTEIVESQEARKLAQQSEYMTKIRKIYLETGMSHKKRKNIGTIDNPKGNLLLQILKLIL